VKVNDYLSFQLLGETRDDAVGEAFDKAAKLLGLSYPGGPLIDQHAQQGNAQKFTFADTQMPGLDFSFSGIKTSLLYFLRDQQAIDPDFIEKNLADVCASYQHTLINMLMQKLIKATRETGIKRVALAGGVAANRGLRKQLQLIATKNDWEVFVPDFQYCTDNAAMIAIAAHYLYQSQRFSNLGTSPLASISTGAGA
jgi:N6-L-threonylcarbamoyladenine synthase